MNKKQIAGATERLMDYDIDGLERKIASLTDIITGMSISDEAFRNDPRKALCKMKEGQLKITLEKYGTINMASMTSERALLEFARCQAFEEQIRQDIDQLSNIEGAGKDLKKQLAIAKEILAEKIQPGGRA